MNVQEKLKYWGLADFALYNDKCDKGEFAGSEATKFDMVAIQKWLSVRGMLTYIERYEAGDWRTLDIKSCHSRYGTNYIYIDIKHKWWRTYETPSEFYGDRPKPFDFRELLETF